MRYMGRKVGRGVEGAELVDVTEEEKKKQVWVVTNFGCFLRSRISQFRDPNTAVPRVNRSPCVP